MSNNTLNSTRRAPNPAGHSPNPVRFVTKSATGAPNQSECAASGVAPGRWPRQGVGAVAADASADAEYRRWLAKYAPEERRIVAAYERRMERRASLRERRARAFGDLCEATEGEAVVWRRTGWRWEDVVVPVNCDAWTRRCAERYFALAGVEPDAEGRIGSLMALLFATAALLPWTLRVGTLYATLGLLVRRSCELVNAMKRRTRRPLYYERETARRRNLAADRRRVAKRTTTSPCPTKEEILDAWLHAKDSKEAALRFGSMVNDLECYVDNSLRFADGRISGREAGIKGWLAFNIPALLYKYKTVMRYKAMAKKVRQIVELEDPVPAAAVLADGGDTPGDERVVRAAALWREVAKGVENATGLMARVDALTDPGRVEDANMLAEWRERYRNEITVRNKSRWWRKLVGRRRERA